MFDDLCKIPPKVSLPCCPVCGDWVEKYWVRIDRGIRLRPMVWLEPCGDELPQGRKQREYFAEVQRRLENRDGKIWR